MFDQQSDGNGYEIMMDFYINLYGTKLGTKFIKWDFPKLDTNRATIHYDLAELGINTEDRL